MSYPGKLGHHNQEENHAKAGGRWTLQKLSLAASILLLVLLILSIVITANNPDQDWLGVYLLAVLLATSLLNSLLIRIGKPQMGTTILIGVIAALGIALPFVYKNLGLQIGLLSFVMISFLAAAGFLSRWISRGIIFGAGVGITIVILDLYGNPQRSPGEPLLATGFVIVLLLFFIWRIVKQFETYSLRPKLIIMFVLITLLPLILFSSLNIFQNQQNLQADAEQQLSASAILTGNVVDSWIRQQLDLVRSEAQFPAFAEYLILPSQLRPTSPQHTTVEKMLLALSRRDPIFIMSYALFDSTGVNVVDTFVEDIGFNEAQKEFFQNPLATALPFASPVLHNETNDGTSSLFFSSSIRTARGEFLGVLRVTFDAQILQSLVTNSISREGRGVFAVLLDRNDYFQIAHSNNPELLYKSIVPLADRRLIELQSKGLMPVGNSLDLSTNQPNLLRGLQNTGETPFFLAGISGGSDALALSTTHLLREQPWIVLVRQPEAIVIEPIEAQRRSTTLLSIFAAVFVALVAVGVSQVLIAPIMRLTEVASRISSGDLTAQAPIEAKDEIGKLAGAFNTMTAELRSTLQDLEQRVVERTRALEVSAEISQRLSTIVDPGELVTEVVHQIQTAFHYYHVHIYLFDDLRENLVLVGGTGEAGQIMLKNQHKIAVGRGIVGRASKTGMAILTPDTNQDLEWLPNELLPETKSEIAVPIMIGDYVLGVLDVQHNVVYGLNQQDVDLLLSIANQLAIALRNAQQFRIANQQAKRAEQIDWVVRQIQSTNTIEDALQVAAREVGRVLNTPRVAVRVYREESSASEDKGI
jgi:putative methionine-R-sulfoxide reductase with GAF domain